LCLCCAQLEDVSQLFESMGVVPADQSPSLNLDFPSLKSFEAQGVQFFPHYIVYNAGTRVLYLYPDVSASLATLCNIVAPTYHLRHLHTVFGRFWCWKTRTSCTLASSARSYWLILDCVSRRKAVGSAGCT
jgi:hypothetical protein